VCPRHLVLARADLSPRQLLERNHARHTKALVRTRRDFLDDRLIERNLGCCVFSRQLRKVVAFQVGHADHHAPRSFVRRVDELEVERVELGVYGADDLQEVLGVIGSLLIFW